MIVRIESHGVTVVAVPSDLSTDDILSLASVVLSSDEFSELRQELVDLRA